MYEPVWLKLKETGKVFIPCKHDAQRVIIKAVQKEKYMDEDKHAMTKQMEVTKHPHGVEFQIVGKPEIKDF